MRSTVSVINRKWKTHKKNKIIESLFQPGVPYKMSTHGVHMNLCCPAAAQKHHSCSEDLYGILGQNISYRVFKPGGGQNVWPLSLQTYLPFDLVFKSLSDFNTFAKHSIYCQIVKKWYLKINHEWPTQDELQFMYPSVTGLAYSKKA